MIWTGVPCKAMCVHEGSNKNNCNTPFYSAGEGGAGTWSDGKLTTRIGRNSDPVQRVLRTLHALGAPEVGGGGVHGYHSRFLVQFQLVYFLSVLASADFYERSMYHCQSKMFLTINPKTPQTFNFTYSCATRVAYRIARCDPHEH